MPWGLLGWVSVRAMWRMGRARSVRLCRKGELPGERAPSLGAASPGGQRGPRRQGREDAGGAAPTMGVCGTPPSRAVLPGAGGATGVHLRDVQKAK